MAQRAEQRGWYVSEGKVTSSDQQTHLSLLCLGCCTWLLSRIWKTLPVRLSVTFPVPVNVICSTLSTTCTRFVSKDVWLRMIYLICSFSHQTPLHLAVLKRQMSVIKDLVSRGVSMSFQDSQGNTPLHIVCKYSLTDILCYFLMTSTKALLSSYCFELRNYDGTWKWL